MYKNQLQELAQRSCFNLPSYACIREGPDHAPRFKATVNFNGETFVSPHFCSTLRQAEHSAAEVALHSLTIRGPSHSLASRVLDETGVYKNLLQGISQRAGAPLPQYTTCRSGLGHQPVFTGTVELAGITFTGEPAKNKKQAEKNAAMAAWTSLKQLAKENASSSEPENNDELEQMAMARALLNYRVKEKMAMGNSSSASIPFTKKFPIHNPRPTSARPAATTSKILSLICPKVVPQTRSMSATPHGKPVLPSLQAPTPENHVVRPQKIPAAEATPYVPIRQFRTPCHAIAPPVTIRTAVPVFSAPPRPPPPTASFQPPASQVAFQHSPSILRMQVPRAPSMCVPPPVTIRQVVPVFAAPPVLEKNIPSVRNGGVVTVHPSALPNKSNDQVAASKTAQALREVETVKFLKQLKI
ncbi:hypothetical protein GQ457_03G043880 [Hibiscus cannabinus]